MFFIENIDFQFDCFIDFSGCFFDFIEKTLGFFYCFFNVFNTATLIFLFFTIFKILIVFNIRCSGNV